MARNTSGKRPAPELSPEDEAHIREVFFTEVVPKLRELDGRIGVLNCGFAGKEYENWTLTFRCRGSDFEIVDFEYDEESSSIPLDV